ncbi:MAG: hypothetical protein U0L15_07785, partial [Oscillospiraceae bacterium]|nr:hypothetical protein [Oscillospiraceae bacterium]
MGVGILRMPGMRIATPVCGLVRNDKQICLLIARKSAQKVSKILSLRASAHTGVAIRSSAM